MTAIDTREHPAGDLRTVAADLAFPESLRWHEGALWFSDVQGGEVKRLDPASGAVETVVEVPGHPSGLGWLPDGRMLVVSMHDRRLLRRELDGSLSVAAELGEYCRHHCNDMVVDERGNAYVGHFGFDPEHESPRDASLLRITPDGAVSVAAAPLQFPNGAVITPDGATMIVAESWSHDITAFTLQPDGSLSDRRLWAHLEGAAPDGICLDAEGLIWSASPISKEVLRLAEGGAVVERISTGSRRAITCCLGGVERRTLFISTVGRASEMASGATGALVAIDVDVPGVGRP